MKNLKTILVILSCILFLVSCEKENSENSDFYNTGYRMGLWVSPDKTDTLEFLNSSRMIRKGYHGHGEYSYEIKNNILFINLPGTEYQSQHPILYVDPIKVILRNMYITSGFSDNSGVFIKQ